MSNESVERYKRLLSAIPPKVRAASFVALDKYADLMMKSMQAMVPRDPVEGTFLGPSIRKEEDISRLRVTLRAGGQTTTKAIHEGQSGSYDYANAQEFGTAKMSANPFFWPSYRLYRKAMRSAVKRNMRKAVKESFPGAT